MNITTKKPVQKTPEYTPPKVSEDQKKLFKENPSALLPRGKYEGQSLQWVKQQDANYYKWMVDKNLIIEWNLVVLKEEVMQVQTETTRPLWTGTYKWIELYEVPVPSKAYE